MMCKDAQVILDIKVKSILPKIIEKMIMEGGMGERLITQEKLQMPLSF
jgi:hypothetical protein